MQVAGQSGEWSSANRGECSVQCALAVALAVLALVCSPFRLLPFSPLLPSPPAVQYHMIPNEALSLDRLKELPYLHRLKTLQGQPVMVSMGGWVGGWWVSVPMFQRQRTTLVEAESFPCSSHSYPPPIPISTHPPQAYTEAGQAKVAATSRQIAFVLEPTGRGPALARCEGLLAQVGKRLTGNGCARP